MFREMGGRRVREEGEVGEGGDGGEERRNGVKKLTFGISTHEVAKGRIGKERWIGRDG